MPVGSSRAMVGTSLAMEMPLPPIGNNSNFMGFSVRSREFRFTAWLPTDAQGLRTNWTMEPYMELYKHSSNDERDYNELDTVNLAYQGKFGEVVTELRKQCELFFRSTCPPTGNGTSGGDSNSSTLSHAACDGFDGILSDDKHACCAKRCGQCGGEGCAALPGGKTSCCKGEVEGSTRVCSIVRRAPCHA
eukprot:SAG31_NODE_804_length_11973_cov_8.406855_5_plen_190_part_00